MEQRGRESEPKQGIIIPLDLPEFEIVSQCIQADGSIEVDVRAEQESAACPDVEKSSAKVHDSRKRVKRDIQLGAYRVYLIVHKRRFRCAGCGVENLSRKAIAPVAAISGQPRDFATR